MVSVFVTVCVWLGGIVGLVRTVRWALQPAGAPVGPPVVGSWQQRVHPMLWWGIAMVILLVIWAS